MTVGVKVGSIIDEIGSSDFLNAFFSTISGLLEPKWASRFPMLLGEFYQGSLAARDAPAALDELAVVQAELARFDPGHVIWDLQDRSLNPPWGNEISPAITSMADYFVTSTGRDLIATMREAFEASRDEQEPALLVTY